MIAIIILPCEISDYGNNLQNLVVDFLIIPYVKIKCTYREKSGALTRKKKKINVTLFVERWLPWKLEQSRHLRKLFVFIQIPQSVSKTVDLFAILTHNNGWFYVYKEIILKGIQVFSLLIRHDSRFYQH